MMKSRLPIADCRLPIENPFPLGKSAICNLQSAISQRRGVALMGVVVAIAVLSVLLTAVTWQNLANRKLVQRRHHQLQSAWLARAGMETAVARILHDPGYKGEETKTLESAKVKITVVPVKGQASVYQIISEARFPDNNVEGVVRSITRRFRRIVDGNKVRFEAVQLESAKPQ
jgi:type II secretory pathway pseudopilin PulG